MQPSTRITLFLFSLILLLTSCNKELQLPSAGEPKIVMLGELTAGDSVYLRAGQSVPIKAGMPLSVALIQNLQMTIEENGASFALSGAEDDLSSALVTIPYSGNHTITPGNNYIVRGVHSSFGEAYAQVHIPQPFSATVIDTESVVFGGEDALKFTIRINDPSPAGDNYAIEATQQTYIPTDYFLFDGQWLSLNDHFFTYDSLKSLGISVPEKTDTTYSRSSTRIMLATDDPASEQILRGYGTTNARRILLSDKNFPGGTHITHVYITRGAVPPGMGYRTLLQVKSVTDDYYSFLNSYEQYDPSLGYNNSSAPVRIQGNVVNGLGMVGGVYRQQFSYFF